MISIRKGSSQDAAQLAPLLLSSAPELLPFLFQSEHQALQYILNASESDNGQYSAAMHYVAEGMLAKGLLASVALWHSDMGQAFERATVHSLKAYLTGAQIQHLLVVNPLLSEVFKPPSAQELCIGHLAVREDVRGKGIGKKLIAFAIKQARLLNKTSLVLDVDDSNEAAISFYYGCDFVVTKKTIFSLTQQTFLRMQYSL